MHFRRRAEHGFEREVEMRKHHEGDERGAAEQETRLDDLHPGGGHHAAGRDVGDHQRADHDLGIEVRQSEQKLDELPRADHLRDEIERHHRQRAGGRQDSHRPRGEPESRHVREGEASEIAQALGDEEQHDRPADEPSDRIDEPIEARLEHQRRDAEERCRRHEVAGDGEAVLQPGDAAACSVEIGGRARPVRGPLGDAERRHHEQQEHRDGFDVERLLAAALDSSGRVRGER